jgi:mannitol/fructose-specific phosphotransferase system IIA component
LERRTGEIRDSEIDAAPSGLNWDIGRELDLVIGIRDTDNVKLEMIGNVFFPGTAFDDNDDLAYFGGLSLEIRL